MPKPKFRSMWMFPRNIRRIEPWKLVQISKIFEACTADLVDQKVQDALYSQLEDLGVKAKTTEFRVKNQGGFRTYIAQLACLGLFWKDRKQNSFIPTYAGELLINGIEPIKILRCQLLRMQFPSVYGLGNNVRIAPFLKVKPFIFLIKIFKDERIEGYLSTNEISIAVVYGRDHKQSTIDLCVDKILKMRKGCSVREVIDSVDDIRTPRRYNENDPEYDFKFGLEDIFNIANTAKNYMLAAQLVIESPQKDRCVELNLDPKVQKEIVPWLAEGDKFNSLDEDCQEIWQQRFGRYNKSKSISTNNKKKVIDGFSTLVQNRFINGHVVDPFSFEISSFLKTEAECWGKTVSEIARIIEPLREKIKDIEYDVVTKAASSGGKEAILLEKAITAIFIRLGFDESIHIGQKKAKREGGYPDIRIKSSSMKDCGFADTKATMRYGFGLGDTIKLNTYYKECWKEFSDKSQSQYFLYIAGGFDRSVSVIEDKLLECKAKYGHPVSAITTSALLELVQMKNYPEPEKLVTAFKVSTYYASAEEIIAAIN